MANFIKAIIFTGVRKFSSVEVNEMLNNFDDVWCADSLPKWLYVKSNCKLSKSEIKKIIKDALKNNSTLDVKSN